MLPKCLSLPKAKRNADADAECGVNAALRAATKCKMKNAECKMKRVERIYLGERSRSRLVPASLYHWRRQVWFPRPGSARVTI